MHCEPIFKIAYRFYHATTLSGRYWKKRIGLPIPKAMIPKDDAIRLGPALSAYYREKQGRGYRCTVEYYKRGNGEHYFFAYPDDYVGMYIGHVNGGRLDRHPERRAFEVVFEYDPERGSLALYAHGDKRYKADLEEIFARVILNENLGPEDPRAKSYELNILKSADFGFLTEPADGIEEVRVRRLRLSILGNSKRRIILEANPNGSVNDVYEMMDSYLNKDNIPHALVNVTQATLEFRLAGEGDNRPKKFNFDISYPSSCNLKSKPEKYHFLGEKYLRRWGIDNG